MFLIFNRAAVALPWIAYFLLFAIVRRKAVGWRDAAMEAATLWGVFLAVTTEALGFGRLITHRGLALTWLALCLVSSAWLVVAERRRSGGAGAPEDREPVGVVDRSLIGGIVLVVTLVGVTAIFSPPNTWDAVSYHMSRVAQWIANRDVAFFPTNYSAQLFLSPWSEYGMLHLDLLYGSDRFTGLIEWSSFVGSIVGVSLIARSLGANRRGQILAAAACAAIPEAVLEASGAMSTCAGAFWIVVAVYFLLRWREEQSWSVLLGAAAATGLAILTKGTAYVFLLGVASACWIMAPAVARRTLVLRTPLILLVILLLNGPLFVRNYRLSGSPLGFAAPLGDDPERQYENSHFSISGTAGNVVKNLVLHVGTPSDSVNGMIEKSVAAALRRAGIDPSDPETTYRGGFHVNRISYHESNAGNPLQLALIALACGLLLCEGRRMQWDAGIFAAGLIMAFVVFCAIFRWQMWNSRYQLPLFALGCGLIGAVLARHWGRAPVALVTAVLLLSALPFALNNSLRPLAPWKANSILVRPRTAVYFTDFHDFLRAPYLDIAQNLKASQCRDIGVDASLQDFDYPLFALLEIEQGHRTVKYAGVINETVAYRRPEDRAPCAVVCLSCADAPEKWSQYKNVGGRASVYGDNVVFSSDGAVLNSSPAGSADSNRQNTATLMTEIGQDVKALHTLDLSPVASAVSRASVRWPEKKTDLSERLDALYVKRVFSWRVQHSADPWRRHGEPMDGSRINYGQALAAEQTLHAWTVELPQQAQELQQRTEELLSGNNVARQAQ